MEENRSLLGDFGYPLQYTLRKTGESVEVIAFNEKEKGARSEEDWVSYIDSEGNEYIKEPLTLAFDFKVAGKMASLFDKLLDPPKFEPLKMPDPWETRRYELVKGMWLSDNFEGLTIPEMVSRADSIISALKESQELAEKEDEYENIGIGEIVEDFMASEIVKKFVFTDRKDIVGFRGDNGRWAVGDKVKVYIKKIDPKKGLQ